MWGGFEVDWIHTSMLNWNWTMTFGKLCRFKINADKKIITNHIDNAQHTHYNYYCSLYLQERRKKNWAAYFHWFLIYQTFHWSIDKKKPCTSIYYYWQSNFAVLTYSKHNGTQYWKYSFGAQIMMHRKRLKATATAKKHDAMLLLFQPKKKKSE